MDIIYNNAFSLSPTYLKVEKIFKDEYNFTKGPHWTHPRILTPDAGATNFTI